MPQHMTSKNYDKQELHAKAGQRMSRPCQKSEQFDSLTNSLQRCSLRNQTSSYCRCSTKKSPANQLNRHVFDAKPLWNDLCHFLPSWDNTSPDRIPLVVGQHQHDDSGDILPHRDFRLDLWTCCDFFQDSGLPIGGLLKKIYENSPHHWRTPTITTG